MVLLIACFLLGALTSRCPNLFLARLESLPRTIFDIRFGGRVWDHVLEIVACRYRIPQIRSPALICETLN